MLPVLLLFLQVPTDTLHLSAAEALARAAARAPAVAAAASRVDAADARLGAARAWTDPTLSASAENVGAARAVTGQTGVAGLEGQVVLGLPVPVGGDRGAAVAEARAHARSAAAGRRLADDETREALITAVAVAERDATLQRSAASESEALERFAAALDRRAAEGRSAGGEAARARLEASLAATGLARRNAALAGSRERLAQLLGEAPATPVVVAAPRCGPAKGAPQGTGAAALALADARADAAQAAARTASARAVPDLVPQVGVRRTAGVTGLFVGLGTEIPVFGGPRDLGRASRLEAEAADAERQGLALQLAAERRAAEAELSLLDAAGRRFDGDWRSALERTVSAAQARYDAGEGTLAELLDARRARLAALDDLATWRAERRTARARVARLTGAPLDAALLCDDLPPVE
jgi:cobalt-zinc-cadmium efflux system outer membrane protein